MHIHGLGNTFTIYSLEHPTDVARKIKQVFNTLMNITIESHSIRLWTCVCHLSKRLADMIPRPFINISWLTENDKDTLSVNLWIFPISCSEIGSSHWKVTEKDAAQRPRNDTGNSPHRTSIGVTRLWQTCSAACSLKQWRLGFEKRPVWFAGVGMGWGIDSWSSTIRKWGFPWDFHGFYLPVFVHSYGK